MRLRDIGSSVLGDGGHNEPAAKVGAQSENGREGTAQVARSCRSRDREPHTETREQRERDRKPEFVAASKPVREIQQSDAESRANNRSDDCPGRLHTKALRL